MNTLNILKDLNKYKRDKEYLKSFYIEERLNKSLETYYKELIRQSEHLRSKNELRVIRRMNKL